MGLLLQQGIDNKLLVRHIWYQERERERERERAIIIVIMTTCKYSIVHRWWYGSKYYGSAMVVVTMEQRLPACTCIVSGSGSDSVQYDSFIRQRVPRYPSAQTTVTSQPGNIIFGTSPTLSLTLQR